MIGYVAKSQVPLLFTFDEEKAEYIVELLAEGLEHMYNEIDLFHFPVEEDPWGEE